MPSKKVKEKARIYISMDCKRSLVPPQVKLGEKKKKIFYEVFGHNQFQSRGRAQVKLMVIVYMKQ